MKITTKADKNSFCPNKDDQRTKADEMHVSPAFSNTYRCLQFFIM